MSSNELSGMRVDFGYGIRKEREPVQHLASVAAPLQESTQFQQRTPLLDCASAGENQSAHHLPLLPSKMNKFRVLPVATSRFLC
jgi:hypothetical protein